MRAKTVLFLAVLLAAGTLSWSPAQAGGVRIGIGIPIGIGVGPAYAPPPYYYGYPYGYPYGYYPYYYPRPVYVQPAPVYAAPPTYAPAAPVYQPSGHCSPAVVLYTARSPRAADFAEHNRALPAATARPDRYTTAGNRSVIEES